MNHDRDAANPEALVEPIRAWLACETDEQDIALEAALLDQGVLCPQDVAMGAYFEAAYDGIAIFFDAVGLVVLVDAKGEVDVR